MSRPQPDEYAGTFGRYVDKVPDGDIVATLESQGEATQKLLASIGEEKGGYRYGPDKWSIKQVVGHIADAELVGGYNTEFGGGRFASYFAAEYLNIIVVSLLATTLFLGGWLLPFGIDPPTWVDPFVVLGKAFIFIFLFIWIRATLPRLRYDQLMSFGWKVLLPLATANALVTAILVVVTH